MGAEPKQATPDQGLLNFPQGVCSHALRVMWLCPPGSSKRKLPIPISPKKETDDRR